MTEKMKSLARKIEERSNIEAKRKETARDFKKQLTKLDREIEQIAAEIRQA